MWNRGHGVGVLMQDGSNMSRITRRGRRDALTSGFRWGSGLTG